ncbi:MAG: hypothetical protein QOD99_1790 [Chthoniobacter sp.]|jgi:hypothetical protein|nr:hypothetical protein [Chthoniobacter sp.]
MNVGFKEWALVCEALGSGRQSIILRKGGIAEGREGFRFKHDAFFLFPTLFHEQTSKLKLPPETPLPASSGNVQSNLFACVEWTAEITDLKTAQSLASFHVWRDEVIAERFHYDGREQLSFAFVRIYRLTPTWEFAESPGYGGCRSWVNLPESSVDLGKTPVLSAAEHDALSGKLRKLLRSAEALER